MPSKLDIDVKNAKALGLSYGYYKALHYDHEATPVKNKKKGKTCPVCGGIVEPPRLVVCSDQCADIRNKERKRGQKR